MSNSTSQTQSGERLTFHQLFDEKGYQIQVPIIQRDYAQGRPSTLEVRSMFLDAIKSYLDENIKNQDLDFVYGSLLNEDGQSSAKFIPLDGQQRLTTLFLLHWYLANKDNKLEEFREIIVENNKSKFTYETRTSSSEFCDALVTNQINLDNLLEADKVENPDSSLEAEKSQKNELSKTIKDSSWFFLSWNNDPTIKSMLVMLDAIHQRFFQTENYYERLIDKENPIITFQFLNLKEFKLTDDLYIKMNARGKPLTPFENFKAKFEQLINNTKFNSNPNYKLSYSGGEKEVSVGEYFSNKIDTDWANLFWKHRKEKTYVFDEQIMNLFKALAATHLAEKLEPNIDSTVDLRYLLGNKSESITFNQFNKLNCFDEEFIIELIELFDLLKNGEDTVICFFPGSKYYDEINAFANIINNVYKDAAYTARIQFYAYCQYLIYWKQVEGLETWMRFIQNLSENTAPYNNEGEFIRSIRSIKKMLPVSKEILHYLVSGGQLDGFSAVQIYEERLKAALILKDSAWANLIHTTETELKYFKCQLTFLLSFSGITDYYLANKNCNWDDSKNSEFFDQFLFYVNKTKLIFNDEGLIPFKDYLWQRALLSKGDYLIKEGSNYSFLIDNDRDISWKRLLLADKQGDQHKAFFIKDLMDDPDFIESDSEFGFREIIAKSLKEITDWRRYFVELPELFDCLGPKSYIRFISPTQIYLLSKERMSGIHYEYYTYSKYLKSFRDKKYTSFSSHYYEISGEDAEPCIFLVSEIYNKLSFEIDIEASEFLNEFRLTFFERGHLPIEEVIAQLLTQHNFTTDSDGKNYWLSVKDADLENFLNHVIEDFNGLISS